MPQFSSRIPTRLANVIGTIKLRETSKKGLAVAYALHLARLQPDAALHDFGSDESVPCNLGMSAAELEHFKSFRENADPVLDKLGDFFNKALILGCSLYKDGYRLSENVHFEKATLIEPGVAVPVRPLPANPDERNPAAPSASGKDTPSS